MVIGNIHYKLGGKVIMKNIDARNKLFEENMDLVYYIVDKKYGNLYKNKLNTHKLDFDDLVQIGSEGLLKACDRFDEKVGTKFSTYAGIYIEGAIKHYMRDKMMPVRFPREVYVNRIKYRDLKLEDMSKEEALAVSGFSEKEYEDVKAYMLNRDALSFDFRQENTKDNEGAHKDTSALQHLTSIMIDDSEFNVKEFIGSLNEQESTIIKMLLDNKRQAEIGQAIGTSQVHVGRIIKQRIRPKASAFFELEVV